MTPMNELVTKEYRLTLGPDDEWEHLDDEIGIKVFLCHVGGVDQYYNLPRGCATVWMIVTNKPTPEALLCRTGLGNSRGNDRLSVDGVSRSVYAPLVTAMKKVFGDDEFWMWFEYEVASD